MLLHAACKIVQIQLLFLDVFPMFLGGSNHSMAGDMASICCGPEINVQTFEPPHGCWVKGPKTLNLCRGALSG